MVHIALNELLNVKAGSNQLAINRVHNYLQDWDTIIQIENTWGDANDDLPALINFLDTFFEDPRNKDFHQIFALREITLHSTLHSLNKGYDCWIWTMHWELTQRDLDPKKIQDIVNQSTYLQQDDDQPAPAYTFAFGDLFIFHIGFE